MAVFSLSTATLNHSHAASSLLKFVASLHPSVVDPLSTPRTIKRRNCSTRTRVASSHSNPKILKSNRRSRYGQPISMYDSDDEEEDDDDDDVGGSEGEEDWSSDVC